MCQLAGGTYFPVWNESRPIARQLEAAAGVVNLCAGLLCAGWRPVAGIVNLSDRGQHSQLRRWKPFWWQAVWWRGRLMCWTACSASRAAFSVRPGGCRRAISSLFSGALVNHLSRLETRTKEFSMQASLRVEQNPKAK